ncbi:MAG: hypothetical protein IIT42_04915 [Clostridia bacterium]|nr:hypothetical protein [Clostridia bacterium]
MEKLTKSQQKVYDYLISRSDEGFAPTVREICDATGFTQLRKGCLGEGRRHLSRRKEIPSCIHR